MANVATTDAPAEQIEGQTAVTVETEAPVTEPTKNEEEAPAATKAPAKRGGKKEEPPAKTQAQSILYSKGDVAELFEMSTQALANRASRDEDFPKPTYTNASGSVQLYTKDDIQAITDYLTRPEREKAERLAAKLKAL